MIFPFSKQVVPDTSNHWQYHTYLLVFCLKLRLLPISEYLSYYHNITNNYWAIPEKIKTGGFEENNFLKNIP